MSHGENDKTNNPSFNFPWPGWRSGFFPFSTSSIYCNNLQCRPQPHTAKQKLLTGYLHLQVNERLTIRLCSSIVDDVDTFLYELDTELLQIIHMRPPSESMRQVLVLLAGYIALQDHYDANRNQSSPVKI